MAQTINLELYSSNFIRRGVLAILTTIDLYNTTLLILCLVATAKVPREVVGKPPLPHKWSNEHTLMAAQFFFFCAIPTVICAASGVEIYKRWRRTLTALHVVVSSCVCLGLWIIAVGTWTSCIYDPPWNQWVHHREQQEWCPFVRGHGWHYIPVDDSRLWILGPPHRVDYLLPWALIFIFTFYVIYLNLGLLALYKQRK